VISVPRGGPILRVTTVPGAIPAQCQGGSYSRELSRGVTWVAGLWPMAGTASCKLSLSALVCQGAGAPQGLIPSPGGPTVPPRPGARVES